MGGSLAPGYSNIPEEPGKGTKVPTQGKGPKLNPQTVASVVDLVMPLYYTKEEITPDELAAAKKIWRLIVNNQSEYFFEFQKELKKAGGNPPELCSEYLLQLWVLRLLDVHPQAKPVFEKIDRTKMRIHFISMITLLIDCAADDPDKFRKHLENLARVHGVIGVRSCECKTPFSFHPPSQLTFRLYLSQLVSALRS